MSNIGDIERITQNNVVKLFCDKTKLDYTYLGNLHDRENSNIIVDRLHKFLLRTYSEKIAEDAIEELLKAANYMQQGLYSANKEVYTLLKYGAKIKENPNDPEKTIYFIDWQTPSNNDFCIAEEVTVICNLEKRPDLVIYVNGIALSVIELKRSTISVSNGIRQNLTNQKISFIAPFFTTIQIVSAGNDSEGLRYGVINTPEKEFLEWKNYNETSNQFSKQINEMCEKLPNKLDWQIYSIYQKDRFLDLIHNYLIFDKGKKKICRHNQYFGIQEAQTKIKRNEGGIIWHTQGSGKSLTMVWLSKWILSTFPNGRVLIITDREELDDQIEKIYEAAGEKIHRTKSCDDLIMSLNKYDDRLMCSLVHKFGHRGEISELDYEKYLQDLKAALPKDFEAKGDIFVFVDECHRTQSGKLHKAMKAILQKAVFIGFTGTPLLKKDKATSIEIFGGYIHTYKFNEGVRDNVILDLRYETRDIPQEITAQDKIDEWFEVKTRGLTPRAKAKLKATWGTMQSLYSSKSRLEKIACDICFDMEIKNRLSDDYGNAILIASSIYEACKYYEIFQSMGFKKCAIISSYKPHSGNLRTETVSPDEDTKAFEKYAIYKKMLAGQNVEEFEEEAKRKFIYEPANMKLFIVVDMLLTGFDAPSCTYLYIDKPMRDHGLFQAICRVNRLDGETKDFGYIIDYKQLFGNLNDAIVKYTSSAFEGFDASDIENFFKDRTTEAKKFFDNTLTELDGICEGVKIPREQLQYIQYFCGENGIDTGKDEMFGRMRERLYKLTSRLVRAFSEIKPNMTEVGYSLEEQDEIIEKVNFYIDLRKIIGQASGDFIDLKAYEPGMRHLIDNYIIAEDSKKIAAFDDFTLLDFIKAQENNLGEDNKNTKESAAEAIENNIRKKIVEKQIINPHYYEKMSAILEKLILERKQGVLKYKELIERYIKLTKNVQNPEENEIYPITIRKNGALRAFYDNFGNDEKLAQELHNAVMSSRMADFRDSPVKENKIKRELNKILDDENEVERAYKIIVEQEEY